MTRENSEQIGKALKKLCHHFVSYTFVSYTIEEGINGENLDRIVSGFTRHKNKILGSMFSGAGFAGGAWAAVAMWTSTLGIWGKFAIATGLAVTPMWVPVAGSMAGATALSGAILGYVSMSRKKGKSRQIQSFIGFSKVFLTATESGFTPEDDRLIRRMLGAKKVDQMEKLLMTSPDTAANLARSLSYKERCEVARHLFPLVYAHCDVITTTNRRRFRRICEQLNLNVEVYRSISKDYRQRLETQWAFVRTMIQFLNYFAVALRFDLREMEILREQIGQMTNFDPRKNADKKRLKALTMIGASTTDKFQMAQGDLLLEGACMCAYALAQTVIKGNKDRRRLGNIFDGLIDRQTELDPEYKCEIQKNRRKVDRMYDTTRNSIKTLLNR